jgi:hypothetical protein
MKERSFSLSLYALSLLRLIAGFTIALYGAKLLFGAFGGVEDGGTRRLSFHCMG